MESRPAEIHRYNEDEKGVPPGTHFLKRPAVIGWLVFFVLIVAVGILSYQRILYSQEARRSLLRDAAVRVRDKLTATLDHSDNATRTLGFIISRYGGKAVFDTVARKLLESNQFIDALELVEGGTITAVYPYDENSAAIGYDILADSLVSREAERAIDTKTLFYAGPLLLKQGYVGVVGRLPLFSEGKFWGFSASIVKLSTLLHATGLDSSGNTIYAFQLSKIDPNTGKEQFFLPQKEELLQGDRVAVEVAEGDWKIYARFAKKPADPTLLAFCILGFLLSVSGGLFAWYGARQPYRLQRLVKQKTKELKASEERYFSFFEKASDTIIVTNSSGFITEVNTSICRLLGYKSDELMGKLFSELVEPQAGRQGYPAMNFQEQGEEQVREWRLVKRNGDIVELEIKVKKIDGDHYLAIGRDLTGLRQAQKQVAVSESTLRGAFEHSAIGMALVSPEEKWLRVNKALCNMLGYTSEEMLSMSFRDITHPEDQDGGTQFLKDAMQSNTNVYRAEKRYIDKGGRMLWVNLNVSCVRDQLGQLLYFVTQTEDITEKKKISELLQVREQQLRLFIEYSPAALAMFDRDMRYLITSKRWISDYGLEGQQVIGKIHYELFPDNPERWRAIHQQCLQGTSAKHDEEFYIDNSGKKIWLRWEVHPWKKYNGDIGGIILFTEVITKAKEAEDKLRESEEKFRNLVEKSLAGVYIMREGKVLYINPAHQRIMGYSLSELQEMESIEALMHKADIPVYRDHHQAGSELHESNNQYGLRAIRKDGSIVYLEMTTSEIVYEGKPALIGTMLDITDRVEEVKRISRAVNEAQEKERMQIGMELHDNVKQIMGAALLNIDFMRDNLSDETLTRTCLENIKNYTKEAIDELRRLSHQLAPAINSTDSFREQVQNLVATMKADTLFSVEIDIPDDESKIHPECRTAFQRILQEQLNNIIKYSNARNILIQVQVRPSELVLVIRDDGQGFDLSVKGGGIGLENIRRRAYVLNGNASIKSSPGNGCEVSVTIPCTA